MVQTRASIMVLVLLGIALAGCIGGDEEPGPAGDGDEARATATTGSLYGRVLDDGFNPLPDVEVILLVDAATIGSATTNQEGGYTMNDLEPGDYRIVFDAICCHVLQESVTVVAGEERQQDAQLTRVQTEGEVYVDRNGEWTGFISCSISYPTGDFPAPCGVADPNRDETRTFQVGPDLQTIVVAMEWDQAPTSTEERLRNRLFACMDDEFNADACEEWQSVERHQDPSPMEYRHEPEEILQREQLYQFRIYAGSGALNNETNFGVVAQQQFTVHWHLFYGEPAPPDYSARPDA